VDAGVEHLPEHRRVHGAGEVDDEEEHHRSHGHRPPPLERRII
jgi:hypothetical protein